MCFLPFLLAASISFQSTNPDSLGSNLRYVPENGDFVSASLQDMERFNRPLYGGNTAFRVDGGDLPEFVLYLPGRGGNIRLAIQHGDQIKWLQDAEDIESRYRPGSLVYHIEDPILNGGSIALTAIASYESEGFILQCEFLECPADIQLLSVYGGLNGQRGTRDGDIGTEAVPISEWFQLKPAFCEGNTFTVYESDNRFHLQSDKGQILGSVSQAAEFRVVDAVCWMQPGLLLKQADTKFESKSLSVETDHPLLVASIHPQSGEPIFFGWQKLPKPDSDTKELADYLEVRESAGNEQTLLPTAFNPWNAAELKNRFEQEENIRAQRASQLKVNTPDPYLNAAIAALCIGSDATWDDPQEVVMHGAIAWRSRLLGWRGPYAMDALGWHERARKHLTYWGGQQNTEAIPDTLPGPDENANLARSEAALHSNGALSHSHYDMNLVYIDALFRHLRWTGDLKFAKSVWPVIRRHLAWEQRMFRRVYEVDGKEFPLYEAYAAIWASDELGYNGGGVAYTSAYNAFHNREAAKLAKLIGENPTPYEVEADAIEEAMRELLWIDDENGGHYAESKDWMGLKKVHANAGVWNVYHTIDSEVTTPDEAYSLTRYIDQAIPSKTLTFQNSPTEETLKILSTTHWFPYHWSINNVVMGENLHTALAYWQANRPEAAWSITKGALLSSMYAGICPGNVGSMNFLDAYRGESQRDFADGSGVMSRLIVEGLFGIQPDLMHQRLVLKPGIPEAWEFADLQHPFISMQYEKNEANRCHIVVEPHFSKDVALVVRLPLSTQISSIRINGEAPVSIDRIGERHGYLEVMAEASIQFNVEYIVENSGQGPTELPEFSYNPTVTVEAMNWDVPVASPTVTVDLDGLFNAKVTDIFEQEYRSPRSPFVSLSMPKQGIGGWAGAVRTQYTVDDSGLRELAAQNKQTVRLPNGVPLKTPAQAEGEHDNNYNILFVSKWDNYPDSIEIPISGNAERAYLLLAGSTNWMQSHFDNGIITFYYEDGSKSELPLHNPTTWWPIDQDFFIDDFQFQLPGPYPLRLDLATGIIREIDPSATVNEAKSIDGGSATILTLSLDPMKKLHHVELKALSNEVVIGLMAITLEAVK